MKIENILRNLIQKKCISKKERDYLIRIVDTSKEENLVFMFQVMCSYVFNINFGGMNTRAILDELVEKKAIKVV